MKFKYIAPPYPWTAYSVSPPILPGLLRAYTGYHGWMMPFVSVREVSVFLRKLIGRHLIWNPADWYYNLLLCRLFPVCINCIDKYTLVWKLIRTGKISDRSRGGARPPTPPYFIDQTEARRADKNFLETGFPFILGSRWLPPTPPPFPFIWRSGSATENVTQDLGRQAEKLRDHSYSNSFHVTQSLRCMTG